MECKSREMIYAKAVKYEIGKCSDIGLVRSSNEDSLISLNLEHKGASATRIGLYAVADGLGGYKGGDVASKTALQVLNNSISKYFLSTTGQTDLCNKTSATHALSLGIKAANEEILSLCKTCNNSMATTLVAALLINNAAYIANVGDSRAYCLEREQIRQITVDHSLVAGLISAGEISPEELLIVS